MKAKSLSKAQRSSSNMISKLPQSIIENILCLLSIDEAARTSILSREWRYKWTTVPKLNFGWFTVSKYTNEEEEESSDIESARKKMDKRCKLFSIIHQVLLMRQAPIHKFAFYSGEYDDYFELDQIILHLSMYHAVKKLTLKFIDGDMYKLPLCAFSLHQLTDLHLEFVYLSHIPILNGFFNLRSLYLDDVEIATEALLYLLSDCPSLERFSLLSLGDNNDNNCPITALFGCLPMIEHLTINAKCLHSWLVLDLVPGELPPSLVHLKYFCFKDMSFDDKHEMTFLALLMKCSPNLEKILLVHEDFDSNEICPDIWKRIGNEYSDIWLEHLKELEIKYIQDWESETEFMKFIMARSPNLKKVLIDSELEKDGEADMLKNLLQAPHASEVEIIIK